MTEGNCAKSKVPKRPNQLLLYSEPPHCNTAAEDLKDSFTLLNLGSYCFILVVFTVRKYVSESNT